MSTVINAKSMTSNEKTALKVCIPMYDFLLVRHCNYSSILYRLRVIYIAYEFLFAFHSNYGRIFIHFGDILRQRMA